MTLIPYDPFQIMRRHLGSLPSLPRFMEEDWLDTAFANLGRVRVDVSESPNEVIVKAEVPGIEKKEDVTITVHENHLHLSGKIERSTEEKGENMHRAERYYGQFSRTIPLPAAVDETGAKASYKNGILEVRLPKAQKQIGKQIDVDFH
jgi:HSP20 family protein